MLQDFSVSIEADYNLFRSTLLKIHTFKESFTKIHRCKWAPTSARVTPSGQLPPVCSVTENIPCCEHRKVEFIRQEPYFLPYKYLPL